MKRYYPSPIEEEILLRGLKIYLEIPELSPARNKITLDTSLDLQKISDHWTHRKVRIWFNNNKTLVTKTPE